MIAKVLSSKTRMLLGHCLTHRTRASGGHRAGARKELIQVWIVRYQVLDFEKGLRAVTITRIF